MVKEYQITYNSSLKIVWARVQLLLA